MKTDFEINAGAFFLIALMLLVLPLHWTVAAVIAAAIHELCHYFALRLLGVRVNRVEVGQSGVIMDVAPMPPNKELICALAGPVGGILMLLHTRWIPRVAVCAAVQSFYNLLPLYPLDGGRAVRCLILMFAPNREKKLYPKIHFCCLICITLIAAYGSFRLRLGILPLLFTASVWWKTKIHLANVGFWDYNSSDQFMR